MEVAGLVGVIELESTGTKQVVRGLIAFPNGDFIQAYVKFLEWHRLGLEILCSELAQRLGLNTPTAYIVEVPRELRNVRLENSECIQADVGFGTTMLEFSTLRHFMLLQGHAHPPRLRSTLRGWVAVMVFDEWIANGGEILSMHWWDQMVKYGLSITKRHLRVVMTCPWR